MTRDELIAELRKRVETRQMHYGAAYVEAVRDCLGLAEQLNSPPAMAWQDEPSGDGWYWVGSAASKIRACWVSLSAKQGWLCGGVGGMRPLNGRRVCPIPAPPALPTRGDA